jgi:hypothetical protein
MQLASAEESIARASTVRETDFILTELWRRREEEGDNDSEVRSNRESGGGVAEGKLEQHDYACALVSLH